MKMNLKKNISFILILLLTSQVYSSESDQTQTADSSNPDGQGKAKKAEDSAQKCNTKLLAEFGLKGQETATELNLDMCPTVKNSCCTKEDQLSWFDLWVTGKGREHLENKFKLQTGVRI
jgi:hypothetical protein